jgi:hypothetical protein
MARFSVFVFLLAAVGCAGNTIEEVGAGSTSQGGEQQVAGDPDSEAPSHCTHGYNYSIGPECFAAACEANDCGTKDSLYDADMCFRPACTDDGMCPSGATCREVSYGPVSCSGVSVEFPECVCGWQTANMTGSFCFPDP